MTKTTHLNAMDDRTEAWMLQRQRNARMGWILGSIAVAFFVGFVAKMALLGG